MTGIDIRPITDTMDPFPLAREQFAANISLHIPFPTTSVALGWALLYFKLRDNRWARSHGLPFAASTPWLQAYRPWVKVFALAFAPRPLRQA